MSTTLRSQVDVEVDPLTAFKVFTEELDCWWLQGPINFHDASRAIAMRMEPGVDGRILEVYDNESGDGLEVARITEWEPGTRLAWRSTLDDVTIVVSFTPSDLGTTVEVAASVSTGGTDRGGTSWVRVTPLWLGRWCARREVAAGNEVPGRLAIVVHSANPVALAHWLVDVGGLAPNSRVPSGSEHVGWIEFAAGAGRVVVVEGSEGTALGDIEPWIFVDDLDAHVANARRAGSTILQEPHLHGAYTYAVADPEGRRWRFAQASPRMRAT